VCSLKFLLKGTVSDGNSYALGGIAGHAGLFSTSTDIFSLMHRIMFASPTDEWINSTTVAYFTKVSILYVMLGIVNQG